MVRIRKKKKKTGLIMIYIRALCLSDSYPTFMVITGIMHARNVRKMSSNPDNNE